MNAKDDDRMSGAVDQEAFEAVIRDNLSPEGVATIVACLRAAAVQKACLRADTHRQVPSEEAQRGLRQAEWFANTLIDLLGGDGEYERLRAELGL